ncbi:MAG: hypothetical protein QM796_21865 [Chthoniobacteraceae bacterium]
MEKLQKLDRPAGFISRLIESRDSEIALINDLGKTGECGLLSLLVGRMLDKSQAVRDATSEALTSLLAGVPEGNLFEVVEWMRTSSNQWSRSSTAWARLHPSEVAGFRGENDFGPLALASMHANGHVREAALRLLAGRNDGRELPYLLVRLNDWVEPIRDATRQFVSMRIQLGYAAHFLRCMPLVIRVEQGQRGQHAWLLQAISDLFNHPQASEVLKQGLHSTDRNTRRACQRMVVDGGNPLAATILTAALDAPDSMERLWAAKQLLAAADWPAVRELQAKLLRDPFMPIRRLFLTAIVSHHYPDGDDFLKGALLDRHFSIREFARFYLKDRFDVADFYRHAIPASTGIKLASAIHGLGECGKITDLHDLGTFFSSPEVRIRKAVVVGSGNLDAEQARDLLLKALTDISPTVSAEASKALAPLAHGLRRELASLLSEHPQPSVRKNALRLISRLSKWERLPLILVACRDRSEKVAREAMAAVKKWFLTYNYSYTKPSEAQLSSAQQELLQSQHLLSASLVKNVSAILSEWRT